MDTQGREGEREGLVFFIGKTSDFCTFVEHLNQMLGSSLVANFLLTHESPM